jgi:uncharacterized membrane protein YidH (DUF202 family)
MQLFLIIGGVAVAALGAFAWPLMSKLPTHAIRSKIFGERAARTMLIAAGLFIAAVGATMLVFDT